MVMCPFAHPDHLLRQPEQTASIRRGRIDSIVVHQAGTAPAGYVGGGRRHAVPHFVIEPQGRIFQTRDMGTASRGPAARRAVHIAFQGESQPLTASQLTNGAMLIAWVQSLHPSLALAPVAPEGPALPLAAQLPALSQLAQDMAPFVPRQAA
ncbi:MAG TPA: hypothetical protein VGM87_15640 [Roseomonas sp.]|jgi:hypothetical protein